MPDAGIPAHAVDGTGGRRSCGEKTETYSSGAEAGTQAEAQTTIGTQTEACTEA